MRRIRAFTLIELLVVIAIIAILSAIIFPVFSRAKDNANRGSDISSMNSLRSSLQLYRVDQGGYPPALLGYVTLYQSGPNVGQVIPANSITGYLYPKRVDSIDVLRPVKNQAKMTDTTSAVWPTADASAVGSAPILDLNGDGAITTLDDPAGARQLNGLGTPVVDGAGVPRRFYTVSGYDVTTTPGDPAKNPELRYALFWTGFGLGSGDAMDDPRQLGYSDPPENTVITWNSHYREYSGGAVQRVKREVVLFLGGSSRNYDSASVALKSWRVLP